MDPTLSDPEAPVLRVSSKDPVKRTEEGLLTSMPPHSITVKAVVRQATPFMAPSTVEPVLRLRTRHMRYYTQSG